MNFKLNLFLKNNPLRSSLLVLFLIITFISLRGDWFFPFSESIDRSLLAVINLGFSILLAGLVWCFFKYVNLIKPDALNSVPKRYLKLSIIFISGLFLALFLIFLLRDTNNFPGYTTSVYFLPALFLTLIFLGGLIFGLKRNELKEVKLLICLLFILISVLVVQSIELTANIGDLMPIIQKQGEALLNGENIYQYFLLDNGVLTQAVRQPGTVIFYLPASIFDFDPRYLSVGFTLIAAFFLTRSLTFVRDNKLALIQILILILFLFMPYSLIRSDLYDPPFWMLLALSLYLLNMARLPSADAPKQLFFASFTWAIAIFTQVWAWLFTPFLLIYVWRTYHLGQAIRFGLVSIGFGALLLLLFILPDPNAYFEHAFGFYDRMREMELYASTTIHLTPVFVEAGLPGRQTSFISLIRPVQIAITMLFGVIALFKLKTFQGMLKLMAFTFLFFVFLNIVSWNYMYVILIVILSFAFISKLSIDEKI